MRRALTISSTRVRRTETSENSAATNSALISTNSGTASTPDIVQSQLKSIAFRNSKQF